jgi:transposase
VVARHDLSDVEWEAICPLIPEGPGGGRPRGDPRSMVNAMLWVLRTGAPWRDLPEEFGPWQSVYFRFNDFRRTGVLDRVFEALQARLEKAGRIDRELWCVDGTSVRASRAAAGARKTPVRKSRRITR